MVRVVVHGLLPRLGTWASPLTSLSAIRMFGQTRLREGVAELGDELLKVAVEDVRGYWPWKREVLTDSAVIDVRGSQDCGGGASGRGSSRRDEVKMLYWGDALAPTRRLVGC